MFDHGLSLLFNCTDQEALTHADVMEDKRVNNFIGSRSTLENLSLIPQAQRPVLKPLTMTDVETLFAGLDDALPEAWRDKIARMIGQRWNAYESIRNQG